MKNILILCIALLGFSSCEKASFDKADILELNYSGSSKMKSTTGYLYADTINIRSKAAPKVYFSQDCDCEQPTFYNSLNSTSLYQWQYISYRNDMKSYSLTVTNDLKSYEEIIIRRPGNLKVSK